MEELRGPDRNLRDNVGDGMDNIVNDVRKLQQTKRRRVRV